MALKEERDLLFDDAAPYKAKHDAELAAVSEELAGTKAQLAHEKEALVQALREADTREGDFRESLDAAARARDQAVNALSAAIAERDAALEANDAARDAEDRARKKLDAANEKLLRARAEGAT